ncbi:MAG: AmmeMemoRadiSam system protein B [Anaerolineales bacterium]|nr:AmmeMemoRadiSam system protein B [Anaerolineales bacterium]
MPNPKLRPLDFQPVYHQGQQMWLLSDRLRLTDQQLLVPQVLAPLLVLCDGTHNLAALHAAFCSQVGEHVPLDVVTAALRQLDGAGFLENARSQALWRTALAAYHAQPHRPPALADLTYPANPAALARTLQDYAAGDALNGWTPWHGRGIISPHIDYQRGGPVYAKVWRRAAAAIRDADLVLIFGTDHNGGPGAVTLTRQPYATPYGVLPTDPALVDALAAALGPDAAFAAELHHRQEHSVELSAVWLHHICQELGIPPKPMVPLLCGSFYHFVSSGSHPAADAGLTAVIHTLQQHTAAKKVVAVASVDLAHVGPQFGDAFVMDAPRRAALAASDAQLMQAILRGDAADFYAQIAAVQDHNRICGFSSIYLLLRYLQTTTGTQIAYEQCPADAADDSLVSICGLLLE